MWIPIVKLFNVFYKLVLDFNAILCKNYSKAITTIKW